MIKVKAQGTGSRLGILAAGLLLAGLFKIAGCSRPTVTPTAAPRASALVEDGAESVRQALRKDHSVNSCRAALQQANALLTRAGADQRPLPPSETLRILLTGTFKLTDDELAEVSSTSFTLLDAHHLDTCLLFRDAGHFLDVESLPALDKATAAFAWVVRQVQLQDREGPMIPPAYILRRGWGTAHERALVFLTMLDQLGLDGCMTALPGPKAGDNVRPWIPGVLVGKEIYLFDTRLGLPLPGPDRKGIATLSQVRSQGAKLFQSLTSDAKHAYDIAGNQGQGAEVWLAGPLSALAPRMKYLEDLLSIHNKVYLETDAASLLQKFQDALGEQKIAVKVWNHLGDEDTPYRVLRSFLPADQDGGTDKPHPVPVKLLAGYAAPQDNVVIPFYRKRLTDMEIFPWYALPSAIRKLPSTVEPGYPLREFFAQAFVQFPLPPPSRDKQALARGPGGMEGEGETSSADMIQRLEYHFLGAGAQGRPQIQFYSLTPGSARDDILRGRFDEGTTKLVETQEQAKFQKNLLAEDADWQEKLAAWCERAYTAAAHKLRAEKSKGPNAQAELETAKQQLLMLWNEHRLLNQPTAGRFQKTASSALPLWLRALLTAAADPMGAEATYQLALCKHEQAVRLSLHAAKEKEPGDVKVRREAWQAAADWWKTYLDEYPAGPVAAAARRFRAESLVALGDRPGAAALLENLTGTLNPLEQTGRLYQARELKK
jgi:hypothetical protein